MMDPLSKVGMWWLLFGGTHVLGSSLPVRTRLIRALGLQGFKGLYSLVSFATFIPLVWVYASNKHAGTVLYASAPWMNTVTDVLMFLALFVLTQGFVTPNPLSTQAEMSGQDQLGLDQRKQQAEDDDETDRAEYLTVVAGRHQQRREGRYRRQHAKDDGCGDFLCSSDRGDVGGSLPATSREEL